MTSQDVKELLIQELPQIIEEDQAFRYLILDLVQDKFAPKQETEDRFTKILQEMQRDREENKRRWEEMFIEIKQLNRKYNSTIGALSSRWGLHSEQSFRTALKSILEESFGVQVLNITEYDDEGEVFGIPD